MVESGANARYVSSGHFVYSMRGVLFAVPFDLGRLEATGGPVPLVEGIRTFGGALHKIAALFSWLQS